jgi:hypothetical protein
MARFHYWGFIVNNKGEPLENVSVAVKLANTDILANLYLDEFSSYNTANDATINDYQLKTLHNGYYEFWIGDTNEQYGYENQKFKIEWNKIGVLSGIVDNIDILPITDNISPVDISNCDPTDISYNEKNKLISNKMACEWNDHLHEIYTDTPHGIQPMDSYDVDDVYNKLVSNKFGYNIRKHINSIIDDCTDNHPHGIYELDINSVDTTKNKLVSDKDIHELYVNMLRSYEHMIQSVDFVYDVNEGWYVDIDHGLNAYYPHITCYNNTTHEIEKMAIIRYMNTNTIRIIIDEDQSYTPQDDYWIKISG